jgi:Family of unknown function (DUF5957)
MAMKSVVLIPVGLIGGFLVGIALSEMIGAIGFALADRPAGITFLPIYLAIACAIGVPILERWLR